MSSPSPPCPPGSAIPLDALLDDRSYISLLLDDVDHESQLSAIRNVFSIHRKASISVSKEIEELKVDVESQHGPYKDHVENLLIDCYHMSAYSDAGHSLAAIGMIAPMLESIFFQCFISLGKNYLQTQILPPEHKRWIRANGHADQWNCQYYFSSKGEIKNNIYLGICQLSEATGLRNHIETNHFKWIEAIFSYRNHMLHGGFEWHPDRRREFETLVQRNGWDEFFTAARKWSSSYPEGHPGDPWIWYLHDDVIDGMPHRMEVILDGIGRFIKSLPRDLFA